MAVRVFLAAAILPLCLGGCLAGAAIGATGAVVGAGVKATGAVVGAGVHATGAVVSAATGHHRRNERDRDHDED